MPVDKRVKRNNVEATIFQLCYHTRNNKTRYRGIIQNNTWALLRCIWINLRRIIAWTGQIFQRTAFFDQNMADNLISIHNTDQKINFNLIINWYRTFFENLYNSYLVLT
ncbi:hypothetical protein ACFLSA_02415, partial [Bacteroidota bacterium]